MNFVVFLILAVIWAVVLIPQLVKSRAERSPSDSIGAFQRQLSVLQRSAPSAGVVGQRPVMADGRVSDSRAAMPAGRAMSRAEARRRRKAVLVGLLATAGATLVLGLVPSLRVLLWAHVLVDVLLVAYVALLVHLRAAAEERAVKVRYLPTGAVHGSPAPLLLRRSAN